MIPLQETFDTVVAHLREQGERAVSGNGTCMYRKTRLDDGKVLKCAAGFLIPDDRYRPEMERHYVGDALDSVLGEGESIWSAILRDHDLGLLGELQMLHDDSANWERGVGLKEHSVRVLAAKYGLIYTPPGPVL